MNQIDADAKKAIINLGQTIRVASILIAVSSDGKLKTVEAVLEKEKEIREKLKQQ